MEINFLNKKTLQMDRELTDLDKFILNFVKILNKSDIKYVVISGYIPILFGRTRVTEDVDLFIEKTNSEKIKELIKNLEKNELWIINAISYSNIYKMLKDNIAIRIAKKSKIIPNIEMKFTKTELDEFAIENPLKVLLNGKELRISPIEMQIAFKLYLGSEKDIEDSMHLYGLFKDNLDYNLMKKFLMKLKMTKKAEKYGII